MSSSSTIKFKRDDMIFNEGDSADCAYIIESGQVEVFLIRDGVSTPLDILGSGHIFGEMAIIDGRNRSASARARTDCQLNRVTRAQLKERVEKSDSVVRLLLMLLVQRIRTNNQRASVIDVQMIDLGVEAKDSSTAVEKIKFESDLHLALERNELLLHYQPIVSLKTGSTMGYEALVRWNSPQRGLVRPDLFMSLAEETSLIIPMGRWIAERALHDFKELQIKHSDNKELFISINVSGKQFLDSQYFENLDWIVKKSKVPRENIRLEITESILLDGEFAFECVRKLKALGFKVSMDDFGTGYSSLSFLSDLEFDCLKIDRSFVKGIHNDSKAFVLCRSILNMARDLNILVVAEGVENKDQQQLLLQLGCTLAQGFLFSRPTSLADLLKTSVGRKATG